MAPTVSTMHGNVPGHCGDDISNVTCTEPWHLRIDDVTLILKTCGAVTLPSKRSAPLAPNAISEVPSPSTLNMSLLPRLSLS